MVSCILDFAFSYAFTWFLDLFTMANDGVDAWEFEKWCEEFELEEDTIKLLETKGFKSYKTINRLDKDKVQQYFGKSLANVPAQLLMLVEAVQELTRGKQDINRGRKDPTQHRTTQVSEPGPSTASQDPLSAPTGSGDMIACLTAAKPTT